jgi:hypothetical protein
METFKLIMIENVNQRDENMEIFKIMLWHKKLENFKVTIKNPNRSSTSHPHKNHDPFHQQ